MQDNITRASAIPTSASAFTREHALRQEEVRTLIDKLRSPVSLADGSASKVETSTPHASSAMDSGPEKRESPPAVDHQEWMGMQFAHVGLDPAAAEAGFRLIGAFVERDEALDHADRVDVACPYARVVVVPRYTWQLVPKSRERQTDVAYLNAKIDRVLELHSEREEKAQREYAESRQRIITATGAADRDRQRATVPQPFDSRAMEDRERKTRARARRVRAKRRAARRAIETNARQVDQQMRARVQKEATTLPPRAERGFIRGLAFPRQLDVRRQSWAAVAWLDDVSKDVECDKEPLLCWLGAFDTEAQCRTWIEEKGRAGAPDLDIYAVAMYEWLFPGALMRHMARQPDAIDTIYENACKQRLLHTPHTPGQPPTIGTDGNTSSDDDNGNGDDDADNNEDDNDDDNKDNGTTGNSDIVELARNYTNALEQAHSADHLPDPCCHNHDGDDCCRNTGTAAHARMATSAARHVNVDERASVERMRTMACRTSGDASVRAAKSTRHHDG